LTSGPRNKPQRLAATDRSSTIITSPLSDCIDVEPGVAAALAACAPVVALESTIITHGMPYPQSLAMALEVEAIVRARGATPATIALIDGVLRVGLDRAALEAFAARSGSVKVSRRDLAAAIVRRDTGGTTVAATMAAAAAAGIRIFATGGIGGVHRGAAETFDVSADLTELGRTPVAVVCAGAKSILDLAKTLEYLETQGVPVLGYGSDEFPAFFSRTSGLRVDHRFDSAAELARVIATQFFRLGFKQGILIANPIAAEDALAPAQIDARIALAVADADAAGVTRKDLTPYLLGRINELTGGASLTANIALVKQNASLAARIAVELARIG
jgi:pseudouridine-5'-phosphate glycosidase